MDDKQTSVGVGIYDLTSLPRQCRWCGAWHGPLCPSIKAIEYHPDGTLRRVEFKGIEFKCGGDHEYGG